MNENFDYDTGFWNEYEQQAMEDGWFDFTKEFEVDELDEHELVEVNDSLNQKTSSAKPRPKFNGKLLVNPAGTIWLVIDGHAHGYRSEKLFTRIHFWKKAVRFAGNRNLGDRTTAVKKIKLTPIQNISFIAQKKPWSNDVGLVRNPAGTVAIFDRDDEFPNGRLYGVPSTDVMNKYRLDWDDVRCISEEEFRSYPMPIILR